MSHIGHGRNLPGLESGHFQNLIRTHPICLILDHTGNTSFPPLVIYWLYSYGQKSHNRTQSIYIVVSTSIGQAIASMFTNLDSEVSKKSTVLTSIEEAIDLATSTFNS